MMNEAFKVIGNDPREIAELYGPEESWSIRVNKRVDKIVAYIEDGDTPWFVVYCEGKISQRVNSRYVAGVVYK